MQTAQDVEKHVPVREGDYGERVATVEPGGVEYIALKERHGKPVQMFYTWLPPNLDFATVVVSVSGAFALQALFPSANLPFWLTFLVIVVAQVAVATFGHNLIQVFERWSLPLLGIVFALACIFIFSHGNYGIAFNGKAPLAFGG